MLPHPSGWSTATPPVLRPQVEATERTGLGCPPPQIQPPASWSQDLFLPFLKSLTNQGLAEAQSGIGATRATRLYGTR